MKTNTYQEHEEEITADGRDYRCLFRRDASGGYLVTCPDIPPMIAFGETLDEARAEAEAELEAWAQAQEVRDPGAALWPLR